MLKKLSIGPWLRKALLQGAAFLLVFIVASIGMDLWRGRSLPIADIPKSNFVDINGKSVDLAELSNKGLTVVYFWATWCGPCKVTSPSVKQLATHYSVVSIAMASGADDELRRTSIGTNALIATVNDDSQAIAEQWGVNMTPTIIFVKNKTILGYTMGASGYPGLRLRAWWWAKS